MTNGRLVSYITKREKPARRGQPRLEAGAQLYMIQYANGRYFYCGYTDKQAAEQVMGRLKGDQREIEFNSKKDPEVCLHYVGSLKK